MPGGSEPCKDSVLAGMDYGTGRPLAATSTDVRVAWGRMGQSVGWGVWPSGQVGDKIAWPRLWNQEMFLRC